MACGHRNDCSLNRMASWSLGVQSVKDAGLYTPIPVAHYRPKLVALVDSMLAVDPEQRPTTDELLSSSAWLGEHLRTEYDAYLECLDELHARATSAPPDCLDGGGGGGNLEQAAR